LCKLLGKSDFTYALRPMKKNRMRQAISQALQAMPVFMLPGINGTAHIMGY
jgi:hypothetical protein